jgi:hypothetical protein
VISATASPSPGKATSTVRTWIDMIRDYVDARVSDEEYAIERTKIVHNTPYDKESYYYRRVFEKLYPGRENAIPYFWRHPFCAELDPSARLLNLGTGTGSGSGNGINTANANIINV